MSGVQEDKRKVNHYLSLKGGTVSTEQPPTPEYFTLLVNGQGCSLRKTKWRSWLIGH